eukprot:13745231-Heterocapsa_arctica.AAC.1
MPARRASGRELCAPLRLMAATLADGELPTRGRLTAEGAGRERADDPSIAPPVVTLGVCPAVCRVFARRGTSTWT